MYIYTYIYIYIYMYIVACEMRKYVKGERRHFRKANNALVNILFALHNGHILHLCNVK